jgi:hypothetical protein
MPEHLSHSEYVALQRRQVAKIAAQMLAGNLGMIEGARLLAGLRHEVEVGEDDPDFLMFVAIESETDHLPVGQEREMWAPESLARKDLEISRAESYAREDAVEACRNLVRRFQAA